MIRIRFYNVSNLEEKNIYIRNKDAYLLDEKKKKKKGEVRNNVLALYLFIHLNQMKKKMKFYF